MKHSIKAKVTLSQLFLLILFVSISCSKDDINNNFGSVRDIDGNGYDTVKIGTQIWMVQNLKTTKFRDGTPIPNVTNNAAWAALSSSAYCNDKNEVALGNKFGRLYNYYAISDTRNIAPKGWHVATYKEWQALIEYLSMHGYNYDGTFSHGYGNDNKICKSIAAIIDWKPSTVFGSVGYDIVNNNKSGFSALPTGLRRADGTFRNNINDWFGCMSTGYKDYGSSIEYGNSYEFGVEQTGLSETGFSERNSGWCVRCVKD